MTTARTDACPVCGARRPAGAEMGPCPACLMRLALDGAVANPSGDLDPERTIGRPSTAPGALSVLRTIGSASGGMPRILLRDTDADTPGAGGPVVRPGSSEMPGADSGRYQLLGEIARGGMGAVLKGRDPDLGRDLAVKVLLESHRDKPEMLRRFVEEAQIAGQLQHPGIVPVYELGHFSDLRPYFTMKLVKGRTLAALLAERDVASGGRQPPVSDDAPGPRTRVG